MNPDRPTLTAAGSAGRTGAALALFAFVFFARAWLIKVWGSPVPFADQWNAEALQLYRPWLDGTLRWADIFSPHNEHRIVLTRLTDLALFIFADGWNPWWQMLFNAMLHATIPAALLGTCWNAIPRQFRPVWLLCVALLFSVPACWQNALWGFQSHVFFCGILSVLAFDGLLTADPLRPRWWLGWVAALLALFAAGSGVLTAVTALGLTFLTIFAAFLLNREALPASSTWAVLAIFVLVASGWLLRTTVPLHEPLRAQSPAQFCAVFFRCLSWPWVDSSWLWLALQAPLAGLTVDLLRRRALPGTMERFVLGLGLLTVLHAAAVAYTRAAGLPESRPLSRYQDPLVLGAVANFFVLLRFAGQNPLGRTAALLWSGALLAGLLNLTTINLSLHLPFKRARDTAGLTQVRTYLATNDAAVFTQVLQMPPLHPNPAVVQRLLNDPQMRSVLPRELFDLNARPPWLIEQSSWLALLGAIGILFVVLRCARPAKA